MSKVRIRKLDAAARQLETALDLYFSDGDLVSAWTLGAAAYNVLRDLSRTTSLSAMMLKGQLPAIVPNKMSHSVLASIQETENFLKHADRDPNAELAFESEGRIELLLFDAALRFRELAGYETRLMVLIRMWFLSRATIQYDRDDEAGKAFGRWLTEIKPMNDESPSSYRTRLWGEASRVAGGNLAEQGAAAQGSLPCP